MVRDIREDRDEVLSRMAEGPIHTRYHMVNEALVKRQERLRTEGNRKARRRAAAKARMREREFWWASCLGGDPQVVEAWRTRDSVSFLVTGNDEHLDEDEVRLIERIAPPRTRDADLPAVGSFHG